MPELSVVVPVFNERDNIPPLLIEIAAALRGRVDYEVVYVDDASSDDSLDVLKAERAKHPELRIILHLQQSGQSTAIRNGVRSRMLRDATPDTGCGLKLFERDTFLSLPYFDHMHRYLPALVKRAGFESVSIPVGHRPRTRGVSKYGMLDRLWVGLADLRGVAWLMRRAKVTEVEEL